MVDIKNDPMIAESKFYRTTELGPISNWTGATTACYNSWLKDAGFDDIYYTQPGAGPLGKSRQIFIGLTDTSYKTVFEKNKNLTYCNDQYWQKVFDETKFQKGK